MNDLREELQQLQQTWASDAACSRLTRGYRAACNHHAKALGAALSAAQPEGGEAVACHRLHTPNGKWTWISGPPAQGALDDAKNFGWTMEYAYTRPAPAQQAVTDSVRLDWLNYADNAAGIGVYGIPIHWPAGDSLRGRIDAALASNAAASAADAQEGE